ncbi:MAG: hypothetical protein ACM3WU_02945 [Bacillota bacterium]
MLTAESLVSIPKDIVPEISETLNADDIPHLVEWLALEDDNVRYKALLLLQCRSTYASDVYPFWDVFRAKLKSNNSYQRSIGLMLMADNAKWDSAGKMEASLDDYLGLLGDEKPITVRQCIQGLSSIALYRPELGPKIADGLVAFDIAGQRETMRKSILLDIVNTLIVIRTNSASDAIEAFIQRALAGDVLDKKAKKQIQAQLGSR